MGITEIWNLIRALEEWQRVVGFAWTDNMLSELYAQLASYGG